MSSARVKAGDVLGGKYRVERVLGQGGMGMVVAARHLELGQRVALKFMLKEAMAEPSHAERFAREARAAVQLQSVHTARVLDVGKLKNGEPFMVMEYLEGNDLDAVLRANGGPLSVPAAVGFMLQACEAFAEAHSLGMIHRDIKPKNLYLTQTVDGRPLVKVLDFGLAKTIGMPGEVSLTATSAVFGSPQYMSPEQMRSAKDVDARSDIWSIGVCLYELLTTRVPFDAPGLAEICAMVLKDPLVPPSHYNPAIPPDLDAVIVKCLAKAPADRYESVADLAFALDPWSESEGSARRILHVMQTVQKADIPTLVNAKGGGDTLVDAHAAADGPKTVDGWDSGEQRTRRTTKVSALVAVMSGFGVLGLVGAVLLGAVFLRPEAKQSSSAPPSTESAVAQIVPTAEPPPVETAAASAATAPSVATAAPSTSSKPAAPAARTSAHAGATAAPPPAVTTKKPTPQKPTPQKPTPQKPTPENNPLNKF